MNALTEQWRPVEGFPMYEVSDQGRVRSYQRGTAPKLRKAVVNPDGYAGVRLAREGRFTYVAIHRLVAAAFIGPCPPGHEVNHKSAAKLDNRPGNLEYVTHRENIAHAVRTGLCPRGDLSSSRARPDCRPRGERVHTARLNADKVLAIRLAVAGGEPKKAVARRFDVSPKAVFAAVTGDSWTHVGGPITPSQPRRTPKEAHA